MGRAAEGNRYPRARNSLQPSRRPHEEKGFHGTDVWSFIFAVGPLLSA